jgi:hypothetical protein
MLPKKPEIAVPAPEIAPVTVDVGEAAAGGVSVV